MSGFLQAVATEPFLRHAVLAGALASIGCGITGTYVVVKRLGYLAGGIAHSVLGGMGAAYYLGAQPMIGALLSALLAALAIGWISLRWQQYEDTLIGAMWAIGMAIGVLFISQTPGYNVDLMSYLFGNILMVRSQDLYLMAVVDLVIASCVLLFYRQFLAVSFDEEFARLRGIKVDLWYLLLLSLVALTVVLLIQVVGLILVIALLTLPAAIAGQYAGTLGRMMLVAIGLGAMFTSGGLALSYAPDLPSGATIILLSGAAYIISTVGTALFRRWRIRRWQRAV